MRLRVALLVALVSGGCRKTPSFQAQVLPVMTRNCASADGCHGDKPTDSVDLDLRPAVAFAQLVAVPSEARKGALRIAPGDPGASFLLAKLNNSLRTGEGKSMPIDADTGAPITPSPLPPDYIEKVLVPWILAGAPDN